MTDLATEIRRRKTFAIISHPDAGKTTLTEKLLLYGGAIQLAGAVKAKRGRAVGRQRLDGDGARARHLDHVERPPVPVPRPADEPARHARPRRLQRGHVSHAPRRRRRGHAPRLREGRRGADEEALPRLQAAEDADLHLREQDGPPRPRAVRAHRRGRARARHRRLSDHLAHVPTAAPFRGVYHRANEEGASCSTHRARRRAPRGAEIATATVTRLDDPKLERGARAEGYARLREEVELLDAAGDAFDEARFQSGDVSPMFFGSAMNNFGLEAFLDTFCELMPPPRPRMTRPWARSPPSRTRSPRSSSRSKRTWTRRTATASRSCASARVTSSADEGARSSAPARRPASRTRRRSSRKSAASSKRATRATSSASSTRASSRSATRSPSGQIFASMRFRASRPSTSRASR